VVANRAIGRSVRLSASPVIARWQANGWDEPCKSRGLRTVLWAAGGEIPPADPAAQNPIYARLPAWGYGHKKVCHARGEYARDEDGDGFCEVHVNTMEGFWSLLRSWLRPHRGISQDKLPLYLGFFQFVHNARRRGKALLSALVATLVA